MYLSSVQSSTLQVLGVIGLWLVLPYIVKPDRTSHRVVLFLGVFGFGIRYLWWRATTTIAPMGFTADYLASMAFFGVELLATCSAFSAGVILMRTRNRAREATANLGWWRPEPPPRVAILIATYNEDLEVLERTIAGARTLRHSNKQIIVLDDGRRDWLRDYCAAKSVRYFRRDSNEGAKAGNINSALERLAADPAVPDFVAVLDADFVPHQGFISRTLALFHDPTVGLVQTPQHFFNPDPIQHNLGLSASFPDEQRFFFDHVQASRDAWGIAICCGTSSMIRWTALQEVGGFPSLSVTEDFLITQVLRSAGWKTVYLNEALTEGLAPEGLKEYITQRGRWGLGTLQIARSPYGPFGKAPLDIRGRWSIFDSSLYWTTSFTFRLAALAFPLLYWFGGVVVVNATVSDAINYFGCYFGWTLMTYNLLFRNMLMPVLNDVQQLVGAIPITQASFIGLFSRRKQSFKVTAKGGVRGKIVVQWQIMAPYLALFFLTSLGLVIGIIWSRFAFENAGDGKVVILFWSFYNLVVLAVTILTCIELPRTERHVADKPERAAIVIDGKPHRIWLVDLTLDTARVRGVAFDPDSEGVIRLPGVGDLPCRVMSGTADGAKLLLTPDQGQRERLMRRFYAQGTAPGVGRVRSVALLRDVFRRVTDGLAAMESTSRSK